ncbi:MAG: hypothetical protein IJ542_00735 [Clostridia bacterium]|nr:hypothetical protein [Clostridia bacterium]
MSKKSLISSLVLGAIATLSLGVYTLVATIIALTTPHHNVISLAYTDKVLKEGNFVPVAITAFSDYSEDAGNLKINYDEGEEAFLTYDADAKAYSVKDDAFAEAEVGDSLHFTAVATTDKYGSTTTYDVNIYHQGEGTSEDDPYLVANGDGLEDVAEDVCSADSKLYNGHINLVNDVDLSGKEWQPIGSGRYPFEGTFNGNGKVVKNLNIEVTTENYQDYVVYDERASKPIRLELGLFGATYEATINAVSIENASISIADDLKDIFAADITLGENTSKLEFTRVGLLVGSATQTTINGEYVARAWQEPAQDEQGNQILDEDQNPVMEDKQELGTATISGKIFGLQYFNSTIQNHASLYNGFGGMIGFANMQTNASNYSVDATINTSAAQNYNMVGGVVGVVYGASAQPITFDNINVNFVSNTQFNAQNLIGGFASHMEYATISNSKVNAKVADVAHTTLAEFVEASKATNFENKLSLVGGVARKALNSTVSNVEVVSDFDLWAKVSGGFNAVENSTLSNVTVSGKLNGFYANGLAHTATGSTITYNNAEEEALEAVNVTLSAHNAAALVDYLVNSNVTATGLVRVDSNISAYGYVVSNTAVNNLSHSSGLVGYFYTTNTDTSATYAISGLTVKTTIANGLDMAGVATYMGTQGDYARVALSNIVVESADLASYSEASYSSTHKAAGAVATVYGNATLSGVEVKDVQFNKNHASGKYGVAMFGGLVARIGGTNVTLDNNKTTGYAFVNYSLYTKSFGSDENARSFAQILAGGLVGAVADFGASELVPGTHPVYTSEESGFAIGDTRDNMGQLVVTSIVITNNNANVDIVIDYKDNYEGQEAKYMYEDGYRARALGSLVGLINNTIASHTDLSTNVATGTIVADDATFRFESGSAIRSSKGEGAISSDSVYYQPAKIVGCTADLAANGRYSDLWGTIPDVAEKPVASEVTE